MLFGGRRTFLPPSESSTVRVGYNHLRSPGAPLHPSMLPSGDRERSRETEGLRCTSGCGCATKLGSVFAFRTPSYTIRREKNATRHKCQMITELL